MDITRFHHSALILSLGATVILPVSPAIAEDRQAPLLQAPAEAAAPLLLFAPAPTYTAQARAARVQGDVVVEAQIDERGAVVSVDLLKGLALGLSNQALSTVRTWRFEPATTTDTAEPTEIQIIVEFRLSGMTGLVHDPETGLTWTQTDNGRPIDLESAHHYCDDLETSSLSSWRLPTLVELDNLFDETHARHDDCTPTPARIDGSTNFSCFVRLPIDLSAPDVLSSNDDTENSATAWLFAFDTGTQQERLRSHAGNHQRALCVTTQRP